MTTNLNQAAAERLALAAGAGPILRRRRAVRGSPAKFRGAFKLFSVGLMSFEWRLFSCFGWLRCSIYP